MLVPNVGSNVAIMFIRCCFISPQHWGVTLPQHSHNVSWMLSVPSLGSNVAVMLTQHCLNFVSMSDPNAGEQCCHSFHATLIQCCYNIGQWWNNVVATLGILSKYNIGTAFIQCDLDIHTTLLGQMTASTNEHCHDFGALAGNVIPWIDLDDIVGDLLILPCSMSTLVVLFMRYYQITVTHRWS